MKIEKSVSLGSVITLMVVVGSVFIQYGMTSHEIVVIKDDVKSNSSDIKENVGKIFNLEKDVLSSDKDIEYIKDSNERMEDKINKILDAMDIID